MWDLYFARQICNLESHDMQGKEQIEQLVKDYRRIQQSEAEPLRFQVQEYRTRLAVLAVKVNTLPKTLPLPITVPVIFKRTYNENFISDYLAYILDPIRNGIGIEPIACLLSILDSDITLDFYDVKIEREYELEEGSIKGRIDLLIQIDEKVVLGIENKIFASEGNSQTHYYERAIHKKFPNHRHYFIYLTRDKQCASSKEFCPISYRDLIKLFRKIPFDWKADIHKSVLWDDFLTHLEVYIMKIIEFSDKAKLYVEHYDLIKDIEQSFMQEWEQLLDYLTSVFEEKYPPPEWIVVFNKPIVKTWHQIYKRSWDKRDKRGCWVHYEYFFSPDRLYKKQFQFMVDVEGKQAESKQAKRFFSLFDSHYSDLISKYKAHGIQYKPGHRRIAVAWKEYQLESIQFEEIGKRFLNALEEFSFLEPLIDELFNELEGFAQREELPG